MHQSQVRIEPRPLQRRLAESSPAFTSDYNTAFRNQVLSVVSCTFRVNLKELGAPTRSRKHIALARQVAMYLTHIAGGVSLTDVGKLFGRDRTTAAHACRVVEDMRDDTQIDLILMRLEAILENRGRNTLEC